MNKYIKKSLSLSMGVLLSTAAFADDTYSYTITDNVLTVDVDGTNYTYEFDGDYTESTSIYLNTVSTSPTYSDYIFYNVTGTSATDSAFQLLSTKNVTLSGVFIGNDSSMATYNAGAVYLAANCSIISIDGLFVDNAATNTSATAAGGTGGAIGLNTTTSSIGTLTGTFVNNSAGYRGGAIYNAGTITSIDANFIGNESAQGGAIFNSGTITSLTGYFSDNYSSRSGGAIYNSGKITNLSGTFVNNTAEESYLGGAIINTSAGTIGITTNDADTIFTGNKVGTSSNAIHNNGTMTFNSSSDYSVIVNDGISGDSGIMTIQSGTTVFNNEVLGQSITVNSGATLELGSYGTYSADLTDSSLTVNGTLALVVSDNNSTISLGSTTISSTGEWILDLSNITGDFVFDIDIDTSESSLDFWELNIILGDDLLAIATYIDWGYDDEGKPVTYYSAVSESNSDYYVEYSLYAGGNTGYTLTGTSFGAAVPEPSTYAMIFGVVALGFAYYRRRK